MDELAPLTRAMTTPTLSSSVIIRLMQETCLRVEVLYDPTILYVDKI